MGIEWKWGERELFDLISEAVVKLHHIFLQINRHMRLRV